MTTAAEAVQQHEVYGWMIDYLAEKIQHDVDAGTGRWGWDPDVDGVVGFMVDVERDESVIGSRSRDVVVIVYLEAEDFEVADWYDNEAHAAWLARPARQVCRRRTVRS